MAVGFSLLGGAGLSAPDRVLQRQVRYVIDFYFHEDRAGTPGAFSIDARPALDSPGALLDRTKMAIYLKFAEYGLPCPVTGHSGSLSPSATGSGQQQAKSS